jgi:hypothetical protein
MSVVSIVVNKASHRIQISWKYEYLSLGRSWPSTAYLKLGYYDFINHSHKSNSSTKMGHRLTNVINSAKLDRNKRVSDNEAVTVLVDDTYVYEVVATCLHSHSCN